MSDKEGQCAWTMQNRSLMDIQPEDPVSHNHADMFDAIAVHNMRRECDKVDRPGRTFWIGGYRKDARVHVRAPQGRGMDTVQPRILRESAAPSAR